MNSERPHDIIKTPTKKKSKKIHNRQLTAIPHTTPFESSDTENFEGPEFNHVHSSSNNSESRKSRRTASFPQSFHEAAATVDDEIISKADIDDVNDFSTLNKLSAPLPLSPESGHDGILHDVLSKPLLDTNATSVSLNNTNCIKSNKPMIISPPVSCIGQNRILHKELSEKGTLHHYYSFFPALEGPINSPLTSDSYLNSGPNLETSSCSHDVTSSDFNRSNPNRSTNIMKRATSLPDSAELLSNHNTHIQSLMVSLDAMLPHRSTFYKLESKIGRYQRTDPRSIIYRKEAVPMPNITNNDIDILQRYSNK